MVFFSFCLCVLCSLSVQPCLRKTLPSILWFYSSLSENKNNRTTNKRNLQRRSVPLLLLIKTSHYTPLAYLSNNTQQKVPNSNQRIRHVYGRNGMREYTRTDTHSQGHFTRKWLWERTKEDPAYWNRGSTSLGASLKKSQWTNHPPSWTWQSHTAIARMISPYFWAFLRGSGSVCLVVLLHKTRVSVEEREHILSGESGKTLCTITLRWGDWQYSFYNKAKNGVS